MNLVQSVEALEALYQPAPSPASTVKELDADPEYRRYIELSHFVALATVGPEELDCSPRGDARGFVRVQAHPAAARPARGNLARQPAQHRARPARGAFVPDPGSGTTFPCQRPRRDHRRCCAVPIVRGGRQAAAHGAGGDGGAHLLPVRPGHRALGSRDASRHVAPATCPRRARCWSAPRRPASTAPPRRRMAGPRGSQLLVSFRLPGAG